MANRKYSDGFRAEAVKQVTNRGRSVRESPSGCGGPFTMQVNSIHLKESLLCLDNR